MIPAELIKHKRDGRTLSKADLKSFIKAYVDGTVPDYQMAALLMAIYFRGMDPAEILSLVEVMLDSGKRVDFSGMSAFIADKHSTGGVGDTVSLVLAPLMAAAGLAIPMLSGRSLGHTGGTLDKLESIPGFNVNLTLAEFQSLVENTGVALIGQTADICPADRRMYALRDVTGTVESIPLICGSIMSKKIAEGIQGLVLDVKFGSGAFMSDLDKSVELGVTLKKIGEAFGIKTDVVHSSMNQPLGQFAGIWCEVREALDCLNGRGPDDTMDVTLALGAKLLVQAGTTKDISAAIQVQRSLIENGSAHEKFYSLAKNQGADPAVFDHPERLHQPACETTVKAPRDGIIQSMDTYRIGMGTVELGSGRKRSDDTVDPTSGIEFHAKIGDSVKTGDVLFRCFNSAKDRLERAAKTLENTVEIGEGPAHHDLFYQYSEDWK